MSIDKRFRWYRSLRLDKYYFAAYTPWSWKAKKTELMEVSDGDVAGLKSATIRVSGEYAFWLVAHRNRYSSFSA